jgi:GGDEF domain-containing protein
LSERGFQRIRAALAQHVFELGEGRVVRTTCSIGFASYPFFREQLDALSWEQPGEESAAGR